MPWTHNSGSAWHTPRRDQRVWRFQAAPRQAPPTGPQTEQGGRHEKMHRCSLKTVSLLSLGTFIDIFTWSPKPPLVQTTPQQSGYLSLYIFGQWLASAPTAWHQPTFDPQGLYSLGSATFALWFQSAAECMQNVCVNLSSLTKRFVAIRYGEYAKMCNDTRNQYDKNEPAGNVCVPCKMIEN